MPPLAQPALKTTRLGGVDVPAAAVLEKMHRSPYILRAGKGELSTVAAQKVLLPRERETSPQAVDAVRAADGTIYAHLGHIICKSSDQGATWSAHEKGAGGGCFAVLGDGRFVCLGSAGEHPHAYVVVRVSQDEGRSWQELAAIPNPPGCWGSGIWIARLPGDELVAALAHPDHVFEEVEGGLVLRAGGSRMRAYRSTDGGRTWSDAIPLVDDWASEGGVAVPPSGTLLSGSRAMISRDDGRTWEDEVYYLDYTTFVGSYNGSVPLDDGRLLTISASSQAGNSWDAVRNDTEVYAIAWQPLRQ